MTPACTLHTVADREGLRTFFRLAADLYRDDPLWVQPLESERLAHLSPANPYFRDAEVRYRIARDATGRPVGRLSLQANRRVPVGADRPEGHFGFLEAASPAVLGALLADAETWARDRSLTRLRGPYSLSINDESGLLIAGHDRRPRLMMNYAPPWYQTALEAQGYAKAKDLLAFDISAVDDLPPAAHRMAAHARAIPGLVERPLRLDHFDADLRIVGRLFNDAWRDNWGYLPLTDDDVRYLGQNLKPILEPALARFVEINGEPAAMAVILADFNEALHGLGGRLLPFGWARLLWRVKVRGFTGARLILMGVSRAWQKDLRSGALVALLLLQLQAELRRRRIREVELSWILEDNRPTIRLTELLGGRLARRYRLFEKDLA